ncbi:MAG: hypothetical protein CVU43_04680 [Chloroflexi bacterium HGW-Chloroflexi-5]|jgi:uncharacterized protein YbjQ (UPF0145 family)|nr:MAG: hypothetical protein CVU43_04680 [Chloroflexi bacterium HGW-Chloroflexi-5]
MDCPHCGRGVFEDSIKCQHCGRAINQREMVCSICNKSTKNTVVIHDTEYCWECAEQKIDNVLVTTTNTVEGKKIINYLGIESSEVVIGTGLWSELTTDFQDFFGSRSTEFEKKLASAKITTIRKIKLKAFQNGANAVVAMDLDYTEFSNNRIGVIASGTLVEIE